MDWAGPRRKRRSGWWRGRSRVDRVGRRPGAGRRLPPPRLPLPPVRIRRARSDRRPARRGRPRDLQVALPVLASASFDDSASPSNFDRKFLNGFHCKGATALSSPPPPRPPTASGSGSSARPPRLSSSLRSVFPLFPHAISMISERPRHSPEISPIPGCGHGSDCFRRVECDMGAARGLDVLAGTPARPVSRSPCEVSHLRALASRIGEISGLAGALPHRRVADAALADLRGEECLDAPSRESV